MQFGVLVQQKVVAAGSAHLPHFTHASRVFSKSRRACYGFRYVPAGRYDVRRKYRGTGFRYRRSSCRSVYVRSTASPGVLGRAAGVAPRGTGVSASIVYGLELDSTDVPNGSPRLYVSKYPAASFYDLRPRRA